MKKIYSLLLAASLFLALVSPRPVFATVQSWNDVNQHTLREEVGADGRHLFKMLGDSFDGITRSALTASSSTVSYFDISVTPGVNTAATKTNGTYRQGYEVVISNLSPTNQIVYWELNSGARSTGDAADTGTPLAVSGTATMRFDNDGTIAFKAVAGSPTVVFTTKWHRTVLP